MDLAACIRELDEALDAHRKRQQAQHPDLTITGMYNVLEKLRSGEVLTAKDKKIHEQGLVSTLRQIHDDLDAAVFDAYGWPRDLLLHGDASWSIDDVAARFKGAKRDAVESVLESLAALGLVLAFEAGGTRRWKAPARAAA